MPDGKKTNKEHTHENKSKEMFIHYNCGLFSVICRNNYYFCAESIDSCKCGQRFSGIYRTGFNLNPLTKIVGNQLFVRFFKHTDADRIVKTNKEKINEKNAKEKVYHFFDKHTIPFIDRDNVWLSTQTDIRNRNF